MSLAMDLSSSWAAKDGGPFSSALLVLAEDGARLGVPLVLTPVRRQRNAEDGPTVGGLSLAEATAGGKAAEVKCEITLALPTGSRLRRCRIISNARNVEVYCSRDGVAFEYLRTVRGTQGTADEMSAEAEIYDVEYALPPGGPRAALRLRLLSLRCGDPYVQADAGEALALHALEFSFEAPSAASAQAPTPAEASTSSLATIGMHLLGASEKRVMDHVDAVCIALERRISRKLESQAERLERIEGLLRAKKADGAASA